MWDSRALRLVLVRLLQLEELHSRLLLGLQHRVLEQSLVLRLAHHICMRLQSAACWREGLQHIRGRGGIPAALDGRVVLDVHVLAGQLAAQADVCVKPVHAGGRVSFWLPSAACSGVHASGRGARLTADHEGQ